MNNNIVEKLDEIMDADEPIREILEDVPSKFYMFGNIYFIFFLYLSFH